MCRLSTVDPLYVKDFGSGHSFQFSNWYLPHWPNVRILFPTQVTEFRNCNGFLTHEIL